MRAMVLGTLMALLVTAGGLGLLKFAAQEPIWTDLLAALATAIVACVVAGSPLLLTDARSPAALLQAGLWATVAHLLVFTLAAGAVLLGHFPVGSSFMHWLIALYPTTLLGVVAGAIRTFRAGLTTQVKS
jgi:hypothetical protein